MNCLVKSTILTKRPQTQDLLFQKTSTQPPHQKKKKKKIE